MNTVGIVFGCFIPWHAGHQSLFDKAYSENEEVVVAVCGYHGDRGENFIPFDDRLDLVKKKFRADPKVTICQVDDKLCGCDGSFSIDNWRRWSLLLFKNVRLDPNDKDTIYTWYFGDQSYLEAFNVIWPDHKKSVADRKVLPISGTLIRNDPKEHSAYIDPVFVAYLKEKHLLDTHTEK